MNEYKEKIKLWHCYEGEYPISQRFGVHLYDENGKCVYVAMGLKAHNGIDFALPVGTKLVAISDGKVAKAIRQRDKYGNHLRLHCEQNGIKFEVLYAHCNKFLVKQGGRVRKGQFIAESGDSGFCKGAHLHFGLRVFDEQGNIANYNNGYFGSIDPLELFDLSELNAPRKIDEPVITEERDDVLVWAKDIGIITDDEMQQIELSDYLTIEQFFVYLKRYNNQKR